jgi:hypothetical protein
MDIYSLGVLLFVLLCGRKPWDSLTSHTLQYAVLDHKDAPGLKDSRFTSLSPAAQELLRALLANKGKQRPSAKQILQHKWLQTCDNAAAAAATSSSSGAKGKATTSSSIHDSVQRRLQVLANSRRVMGTARGLLLMHTGNKKTAAAYHLAVREAHKKLQEQAAALKQSGGLQLLEEQQQQVQLQQLKQGQLPKQLKQQEQQEAAMQPSSQKFMPTGENLTTAQLDSGEMGTAPPKAAEGKQQSSSEGGGGPVKSTKLARKSHPGILSTLLPAAAKVPTTEAAASKTGNTTGEGSGGETSAGVSAAGALSRCGAVGKSGIEKFTMRELVQSSLAVQGAAKGLSDGGGAAAAAMVGLPPVMGVRGMSGPVFPEVESSMAAAVAAGPLAK